MSMWAAGELASCRYCLEQKMEALWTYIISVDQLLAFKMRGKRCCEALCLLKPRPDVQASRLPHSFTCLSSPSSLYSLYPLLSHPSSSSSSCAYFCHLTWGVGGGEGVVIDRSLVASPPRPQLSIHSPPSSSHLTLPLQLPWSSCPCNTPAKLMRLVQSACALSL